MAPVTKVKLALCIDTPDFIMDPDAQHMYLDPIEDFFWDIPARLVDRAVCETDETTLQLLPYIVVLDPKGKMLHYSRGKAGAEERLKANTSIGLGGHVDNAVVETVPDALWLMLQDEAKRELMEEIGLQVNHELNFTHLIIDRTNPVGRVHLGLLCVYQIQSGDMVNMVAEEDQITDLQWVDRWKLFLDKDAYNRLENWSKLALNHIVEQDVKK